MSTENTKNKVKEAKESSMSTKDIQDDKVSMKATKDNMESSEC